MKLNFSDRFGTEQNSIWCQIYRKSVYTIQIWFYLEKFRKYLSKYRRKRTYIYNKYMYIYNMYICVVQLNVSQPLINDCNVKISLRNPSLIYCSMYCLVWCIVLYNVLFIPCIVQYNVLFIVQLTKWRKTRQFILEWLRTCSVYW